MTLQQLLSRWLDALDLLVELSGEAAGKELCQLRDVLLSLAQRRHVDRHDVEAIVEVLSKLSSGHHLGEVAVGGSNDPNVALQGSCAAKPLELMFLQHTEYLGLRVGTHVADFVEEQIAPVGLLEAPHALSVGAGERPLLVAE